MSIGRIDLKNGYKNLPAGLSPLLRILAHFRGYCFALYLLFRDGAFPPESGREAGFIFGKV